MNRLPTYQLHTHTTVLKVCIQAKGGCVPKWSQPVNWLSLALIPRIMVDLQGRARVLRILSYLEVCVQCKSVYCQWKTTSDVQTRHLISRKILLQHYVPKILLTFQKSYVKTRVNASVFLGIQMEGNVTYLF